MEIEEINLDPGYHEERGRPDSFIACPRAVVAVMERRGGVERHRLPCMSRTCEVCVEYVDARDARRVLYGLRDHLGMHVARRLTTDWRQIKREVVARGGDVAKCASEDPDVIWVISSEDLGGYGPVRESGREEVVGEIMSARPIQPPVLLTGTSLPSLEEWKELTHQDPPEAAGRMFFASTALPARAFIALARQYGLVGSVDGTDSIGRLDVNWHDRRFKALRKRILRDYAATRDVDDWMDVAEVAA
ncbi:MAG: hypothetical protein GY773_00950 [Actinomycetia bacterium]|nr:hypothetical protein [Actinomycetes bacterium]